MIIREKLKELGVKPATVLLRSPPGIEPEAHVEKPSSDRLRYDTASVDYYCSMYKPLLGNDRKRRSVRDQ
jgi:hypothetical protein